MFSLLNDGCVFLLNLNLNVFFVKLLFYVGYFYDLMERVSI